ncbi:hypothetical protein PSENEW3n2_00000831 [Picochlorum sp. SENEW3]|nr:hypothetical protein PSENEW3n2_00000831 [Picochlorum sp. SENEW3]WPT15753.1 hypothetical protein PSENEW3_00000831 [Picochlorum sp. SENEW3]
MPTGRKRVKSRLGLCNCGGELRKKGINIKNKCDGTKFLTETACRSHHKLAIERIRKIVKNARQLLEEEPVLLPKFIHQPIADTALHGRDQGVHPEITDPQHDHEDEIGPGSDHGGGFSGESEYFPSNGCGQQSNCQSDQSPGLEVDQSANCDISTYQSSCDERDMSESGTKEEVSPEIKEIQMGLKDSVLAFTSDEVQEEFCDYEEPVNEFTKVQEAFARWRDRCAEFYPGSSKTVGQRLAQRLEHFLAHTPPIGQVWEHIDMDAGDFIPGVYPTSKEIRSLIRQLGLGFKLQVTCEHHHPAQPGKKRGQLCGYRGGEGSMPCSSALKIGIRSSSIEDFVRTQLLDPSFGRHVRECNKSWNPDTPKNVSDDKKIDSIFEARFYRDTLEKYPDFFYGQGHEKLHFALFVDGFQPFEGVKYTLFAVILICLNLPPEVRMKPENLHILKLIDGPKEPTNFQQYIEPIVDELEQLWERGMRAYDASQQRTVYFKGMLACCIQDGRASLACSCQSEAGHYQGCRVCTISGTYANGVHYTGHRGMLCREHPYRTDPKFGPPTAIECIPKTREFIMSRMRHLEKYPQHENQEGMLGVKGVSQFSRLPYFDVSRCHILCFMHSMMNSVKRLEKIYFDNMDTFSQNRIRRFLTQMKPNSSITANFGRFFMPSTTSKNTEEDDRPSLAKKRAQHYKDFAVTGVLGASLLAAGVQKEEAVIVSEIFEHIGSMLDTTMSEREAEMVEQSVWECLCHLETFIPSHFMTLAIHNTGHFARQIINFGPVRETWAFGTESKLGMMKRRAFNRYLPGATIMHRQVYEDGLRIIARISSSERLGANRREKDPGEAPGTVFPCGAKSDIGFTAADNLRHAIMEHIQTCWPESQELIDELALEENESCLWEVLDESGCDTLKEHYEGRRRSIVGVWPTKACSFKSFKLNGVTYETYASARKKSRTDNSNILYKAQGTTQGFEAGRIESILEVQFEATTEIFIAIRPYRSQGGHPILPQLLLLGELGSQTIWIEPHSVYKQIFVAEDKTIVANGNKYLAFRKRKLYKTEVEPELDEDVPNTAR